MKRLPDLIISERLERLTFGSKSNHFSDFVEKKERIQSPLNKDSHSKANHEPLPYLVPALSVMASN